MRITRSLKLKVDGASGPAMDVGKKDTSEPWPSRDLEGEYAVFGATFCERRLNGGNYNLNKEYKLIRRYVIMRLLEGHLESKINSSDSKNT